MNLPFGPIMRIGAPSCRRQSSVVKRAYRTSRTYIS